MARPVSKFKITAPRLFSSQRAERRKAEFEARMEREYGKDWRGGPRESHADRIIKSAQSNRFIHDQPFKGTMKAGRNIKDAYMNSMFTSKVLYR